jgi:hypothetical protein
MSVWLTKSSGRDREYIVLKHTLRGVNYVVNGIKFRNGYAVVEKDSKTYIDLKKIPVLRAAMEFPLVFLRKLPFITRPLDVKLVYGADVYVQYLKQLDLEIVKDKEIVEVEAKIKKVEAEIKHIEEKNCCYRTERSGNEDLCKEKALEQSPSGYCLRHILEEPRLQELGIEVPKFIVKKDKWAMKEKVAKQLAALKKEG